ncbi:hypothetical protein UFOVP328_414 [uncultured Caudovirales phage]|uniref:Uncharacterized protein n=1 Tax=uncultured Caudovirales phage TaxID=2100421 RepID=A0A6J5LVX9_9CAUD|nr:hypothetical protein UFOVP328_414 [uncultured Caudovirales phage]
MIVKTFDNGWGNNFPLKRYEQSIVQQYIQPAVEDSVPTVVINSVWYTGDYHQQVLAELRTMKFDRIIVVALLDAAIPRREWYDEFDVEVRCMGYYYGPDQVDLWAMFFDQYLDLPEVSWLTDHTTMDTAYMCLNRKPHWHRLQLYRQLESFNLLDRGMVSMGSNSGPAVRILPTDCEHDNHAPNASREHYGIPNDIASVGHLENWRRCFLNIVTETVFNINQNGFVSEKIYKPIAGCRPFLIYDSDGATKWLTDRGFETFTEDFKDICDLDLTHPGNIVPFLQQLCQQDSAYWQSKYVALRDKILYNKTHFTEYVKQQKLIVEKGIQCQI